MKTLEEQTRAVATRATDWVVTAGLAHRALLTPATLFAGFYSFERPVKILVALGIMAVIGNCILVVAHVSNRFPKILRSRIFLILDLGVAAGLNLTATNLLPENTIAHPGADVFWQYALGTVVVWTGLRSGGVGVLLVAAGGCLQEVMFAMNSQVLSSFAIVQGLGRVGWLIAGWLVPLAILKSATRGSRVAIAASAARGRIAESARILCELHDVVLQSFGEIVRRTASRQMMDESLLANLAAYADSQSSEISVEGHEHGDAIPDIVNVICGIAQDFRQRGLQVDLILSVNEVNLPPEVTFALAGASREALNNSLRYSGTGRAKVLVTGSDEGTVCINVSDDGQGFDVSSPLGYGITNSIMGRVQGVGGEAYVESHKGVGTTVRILWSSSRKKFGNSREGMPAADAAAFSPATLESEGLGWFAVPALVYRACLTPLQVALAYGTLKSDISEFLLAGMTFVWAFDLCLLIFAVSGRFGALFRSQYLLMVDIALAVAVNIWNALELPPGSALHPGYEFAWGYIFGTVILWAALRGVRTGTAVVGVAVVMQLAMIVINDVAIDRAACFVLVAQVLKLSAALLLAVLLSKLARRGLALALTEGRKVGEEYARSEGLRALYLTAVDTMRAIAKICHDINQPYTVRARTARGLALQRIAELRKSLSGHTRRNSEELMILSAVESVVDEFQRLGLRVELVCQGEDKIPSREVLNELMKELHEALFNSYRHASVSYVIVSVEVLLNSVILVVRDHGSGFNINSSPVKEKKVAPTIDGLAADSVTVETWSQLEQGTRVRIAAEW